MRKALCGSLARTCCCSGTSMQASMHAQSTMLEHCQQFLPACLVVNLPWNSRNRQDACRHPLPGTCMAGAGAYSLTAWQRHWAASAALLPWPCAQLFAVAPMQCCLQQPVNNTLSTCRQAPRLPRAQPPPSACRCHHPPKPSCSCICQYAGRSWHCLGDRSPAKRQKCKKEDTLDCAEAHCANSSCGNSGLASALSLAGC